MGHHCLCLQEEAKKNQSLSFHPQFLGPRNCLQAWAEIGATQTLLKAISKGVKAPLTSAPVVQSPQARQEDMLQSTIGEYLQAGAIRKLTPKEQACTRTWTPIFGLEKRDSQKIRVITDLRVLNRCCQTGHHKPETWKTVLQLLQDPLLTWATKLDLQSWYHNLAVHPRTARWMRFQLHGEGYQIQAMPFGWNLSSQWSHVMSQPIKAWLHQMGIKLAWFVDDILILGTSKEDVLNKTSQTIHLLTRLGLKVNIAKCSLEPAQEVDYLGQRINLATNTLSPLPNKTQACQRAVRKCLKGHKTPPRFVAKVAGMLLDQAKGNPALHGYPQQLMRLAAQMASFHNNPQAKNVYQAWNAPQHKTELTQELLDESLRCLQQTTPKVFRATSNLRYLLSTDASDLGWGASLSLEGKEIKSAGLMWTRNQQHLHSTHKEALATSLAMKFLLPFVPEGCTLELQTDSLSTMWLWNKGSRIRSLTNTIWRQVQAIHKKKIFCVARHVPGVTNRRADWLSRNSDPKNYRLRPAVFRDVCHHFQCHPTVDLFASRRNKQLPRFCSWRVDPQSLGSAWDLHWGQELGWCNPPWELIPAVLDKIRKDRAKVLCCLPNWRAQWWFPTLQGLMTTPPLIFHNVPLYQGPNGDHLPPHDGKPSFVSYKGDPGQDPTKNSDLAHLA